MTVTALRTREGMPVLHSDALQGFAGDAVRALAPYTEASDVGVLATLLAGSGAMIGSGPHVQAGGRQPGRVWPLLIGGTSSGRKGTAVNLASNVLAMADLDFMHRQRTSGLSTGEGLIHLVRDPAEPTEEDLARERDGKPAKRDMGAEDKRVLVVESEFARVLAASKREASTLSAVLREAWDGTPLAITTRANPLRATGHHIVVVGSITPTELRTRLADVEVSNGLVNRFLMLRVTRSKLDPSGERAPDHLLAELGNDLRRRLSACRSAAPRWRRTEAADQLWRALYLGPLNPENEDDSLFAQAISRAAPQVVRLSLLYAVLDGRPEVDVEHLAAAAALWDYSVASARMTFGSREENGEPEDLERLAQFVRDAGDKGRTRTEVTQFFRRAKSVLELDGLCQQLVALDGYELGAPPDRSKHPVLRATGAVRGGEASLQIADGPHAQQPP